MNKWTGMGRLTRDPDMKATGTGVPRCTFSIAIDRRFQKQGEEKQADFINCVAWRLQADLVAKHFRKGSKILVVGSIQTRKYEDSNGQPRTATEVNVEEVYFVDSKRQDEDRGADAPPPEADDDTSLPFDL